MLLARLTLACAAGSHALAAQRLGPGISLPRDFAVYPRAALLDDFVETLDAATGAGLARVRATFGAPDLALAAALCETVDAYGFGAYRGRGGAFAYIHFYDEEPWLGDAKGGELVFAAELRNALFDALGVFRWVWW